MTGDPDDIWIGDDKFAHHVAEELTDAKVNETDIDASYQPFSPLDDDEFGTPTANDSRYKAALERRIQIYNHMAGGMSAYAACDAVGISYQTYKGYRARHKAWAAKLDVARHAHASSNKEHLNWSSASAFIAKYFGLAPTWFQLLFLQELEQTRPGNILMALWPPEHGKTTTFENWASMKLALDPGFRFLVASENRGIAQKILGRVMSRMDPLGPMPDYVRDYGPFVPQTGGGMSTLRQPWTDVRFRVFRAKASDERNYSMEAVGAGGSIVSARTDQLHVDDPQSTKTLNLTPKLESWLRQDGLSRPAESGITSIVGTRVGEDDLFEALISDRNLDDILKLIRFPAIITDNETGEQKPLWEWDGESYNAQGKPVGHTLETLDRMRRKSGDEAWDRNWMQNPGASRKGKGTFAKEPVERCQDPARSLHHHVGDEGERDDAICYIGLDPALGGQNCIMVVEVIPRDDGTTALCPRRIVEDIGFARNEQIMSRLEGAVRWAETTGNVTDVVIEDKNFQLGLKNDERLEEMSRKYGFEIRGHTTGWNKYDDDIGVASMATSFIKGEIILPWADDELTRHEIGELKRQLFAWKPGARGSRLRQDRVMALWFVWMLWRSRRKSLEGLGSTAGQGFQRQTMPGDWLVTGTGLMVPKRGAA